MALFLLMVAPFVDKNPSHKPKDRKFAISIFTLFVMMWAVLVIIGSFFRGPGFNFVFPWKDGDLLRVCRSKTWAIAVGSWWSGAGGDRRCSSPARSRRDHRSSQPRDAEA